MKMSAGFKGKWAKYKNDFEKKDVKIPGSDKLGRMFGIYGKTVFKLSNWILSLLWSFLAPVLFSIPAVVIVAIVIALLIFDAIIKFQIQLFWQLGNESLAKFGKIIGGILATYLKSFALVLKGILDSLAWTSKMAVKGVLYCVNGATTALSGVVLNWMQGDGAILGNKYDLIANNLSENEIEQLKEEQKKKVVEITYTENQNYEIDRRKTLEAHEKKADMLQYSFRFGKYWEQALATGLVREMQLETYYDLIKGQSDTPTSSSVNTLIQNSDNKAGQIKDVYYWRYRDALAEKDRLEKEVRKKELSIVNTATKSSEEIDLEIEDKEKQKVLLQEKISEINNEINGMEKEEIDDEVNNIINKYKQAVNDSSDAEIKKESGGNITKAKLIEFISTPEGVKALIEQQLEGFEQEYYGRIYYDKEKQIEKKEEGLLQKKQGLEEKFEAMDDYTLQMLNKLIENEDSNTKIEDEDFDEEEFKKENDYEGFKELIKIKYIENSMETAKEELSIIDNFIGGVDVQDKEIQDKEIEIQKIKQQIEDLDYEIKNLKAYKTAGSSIINEDESLKSAKEALKAAKEKLYGIYMEDNLLYAIEDDGEFSNENKINYIMELFYEDEEVYPELKEQMADLLEIQIDDIDNTFNRFVGGSAGFDNVSIDEALNSMVQKKYGGYGYPKSYYTKKTADNENVIGAQLYTYEKTAITAPENLKLVKIYMDYEPIERGQRVVCMNFVSEDGAREYKVKGIEEISRFFNAKVKKDYDKLAESGEFYEIGIAEDGSLIERTKNGYVNFTEKDYTYEHIIIPEGVVIGTFGKNIVPLTERRKGEEIQNKITEEEKVINNITELEDGEDYYDRKDEDGLTNKEKIEIAKEKIAIYKEQLAQMKKGDVYDYIFVELNEDSTNSVLDVEPDFIIPVYEKGKYRFAVTKKEMENSLGSKIYGGAILSENSGSINNIGYGKDGFNMFVTYANGSTKTYTEEKDNIVAFGDVTKTLLNKIDPYWDSKYYIFDDDEFDIEKGELLGTNANSDHLVGVYAEANYKILSVSFWGGNRNNIQSFDLLDVATKKVVTKSRINLSEAMKNKLRNYDKYRIMRGDQIGVGINYEVSDISNDDSVRKTVLNRSRNEINYEGEGYCEILEVGRDDNGLLKIKLRTMPDYKIKEYIGLVSLGSKVTDKLSSMFNRYNDNYDASKDKDRYNKDYIYSYAKWNEMYYDVEKELKEKKQLQEYLEKDEFVETKDIGEENKIAAYEAVAFKGRVIKSSGNSEDGSDLYFDDLGSETEIIAPENCILTGAGWNIDTGYTLRLTSLDYERRYTFSELNSFSSWISGVLGNKLGPDWKDSGKFEEIDEYRIIEKGEKIGRMGASKGPNAGNIPMIAPETLRITKFGRIKEDGEKKYCVTLESLDGERVYEIEDMDVFGQEANTGIKGDLRKSNQKVKLAYNEVEYNKCYMLTDEEVAEKKVYKSACHSDGITPGSTISDEQSDEIYGKGYGIRPIYLYEGEIIGYVKMKKVQDSGERYATGDVSKKLQTKIRVKNNSFSGYNVNEKSSNLIIRRKAKISDLFDAVHVNVSVEKFGNLIPENFDEKITSRVVKIQDVERTNEGFNLKYREGNHRVGKIICYNSKGEVVSKNELVYAAGNNRIDKIKYYKEDEANSKEKVLTPQEKYTRSKIKDKETNSDVIELTIPIQIPNEKDRYDVAKIVVYDSTGNSVSYDIKGVSKVEKNAGVVTVTVVAPKNVGVRRLELYDNDKNIIMEKNVEYKNRNEMKFDFVTDKDIYQVKLYGCDGSTLVWKPEITYINKVDENTIKLEFVEGIRGVEKIEYYDSNNKAVKLQDEATQDVNLAKVKQGSKYEIVAKVPNAYDIKKILIYDKDGKSTEYKCLSVKDVTFLNESIMNVKVVVDKNDGVESIECYDNKDKLVIVEKENNKNQESYSIDIKEFGLESKDIKEVRVYSTNGEASSYKVKK